MTRPKIFLACCILLSAESWQHGLDAQAQVQDRPRVPDAPASVRVDVVPEPGPNAVAAIGGADLIGGLDVQLEFYRAIFGVSIGGSGIQLADLSGDGQISVLVTARSSGFGGSTYWYVLAAENGEYVQKWISHLYSTAFQSLRTTDLDGDGDSEICVGGGNEIIVYDGNPPQRIRTTLTLASAVRGLNIVDVDSDNALEYVFVDANNLYIYDVASSREEYIGPYGGWDVAVGNVDGDAAREIVIGDGDSTGYVLNGQSREIEWEYGGSFGDFVRLGDLDGDGIDEIVAGSEWYKITILNAGTQLPIDEIDVDLNLDALRIADLEGDGLPEIIYGDAQWGAVYVHDGQTRALKWSIDNPEHGVTDMAIGDSDGDGVNELLWGTGSASGPSNHLLVADVESQTVEWINHDVYGPFYALDHGDVDADGRPELLYGVYSSKSGFYGGFYYVHDAVTKVLEYTGDEPPGAQWDNLWRMAHANVDADPQAEIFILSMRQGFDNSRIFCIDGLSHELQWQIQSPDGLAYDSAAVADVDGDGDFELVAGTRRKSLLVDQGTPLYVYDAANGAEVWHSESLGVTWASLSLLRLANVDSDPALEMLVADYGGVVYGYDGLSGIQELQTGDLNTTALEVHDRDGDGRNEIFVGTASGTIGVIDHDSGTWVETIASYEHRIDGLGIADLNEDGAADYVFCLQSSLAIENGLPGQGLMYLGSVIGDEVGRNDSLRVGDIDEDGLIEIIVNAGVIGLHVYEVDLDTTAPFIEQPAFGVSFESHGFTGYIDPRSESSDGVILDVGINRVEVVFSEPVRSIGGAPVDAKAFTIRETGSSEPNGIWFVLPFGNRYVVYLNRIIGLQEWTTIEARVEDLAGNLILSSGDLGPHAMEPDRIDVGFLPGDIDQNGSVQPIDLLRFRQMANHIVVPARGIARDYIDTDNGGYIEPIDFLAYRQMLTGHGSATRAWAGATMNSEQP